jgi:hypothetical protein
MDKKIIIFKNADKEFHEKPHENLGCLTHPFSLLIPGSMNSGKSNVIMNILYNRVQCGRSFQKIYIWHFDSHSDEYNVIEHEKIHGIPELTKIDRMKKNLIIIEDVDIKALGKDEISKIDRCLGYICTHMNCSIIITSQQGYAIPVQIRRLNTHLIIWKASDKSFLSTIEQKINCEKGTIKRLLHKYCIEHHDFLLFCFKEKPQIRFNLFEPIEIPS